MDPALVNRLGRANIGSASSPLSRSADWTKAQPAPRFKRDRRCICGLRWRVLARDNTWPMPPAG